MDEEELENSERGSLLRANSPAVEEDERGDRSSVDSAICEAIENDESDDIEQNDDSAVVCISYENDIIGVASFIGKLYLLCRNSKTLLSFSETKPYERDESSDITIKELENPGDMVACKVKKCLYISDKKTRVVYKITETTEVIKLSIQLHGSALLSVTAAGQLLIIDRDKRIVLFGSDDIPGRRVINLPTSCRGAVQAAHISNTLYLINCRADSNYKLRTVDITKHHIISERSYKSMLEDAHLTYLEDPGLLVVSSGELTILSCDSKGNLSEINLDERLKSLAARRSCAIDYDRLLIGCSDGAYVVNISSLQVCLQSIKITKTFILISCVFHFILYFILYCTTFSQSSFS